MFETLVLFLTQSTSPIMFFGTDPESWSDAQRVFLHALHLMGQKNNASPIVLALKDIAVESIDDLLLLGDDDIDSLVVPNDAGGSRQLHMVSRNKLKFLISWYRIPDNDDVKLESYTSFRNVIDDINHYIPESTSTSSSKTISWW